MFIEITELEYKKLKNLQYKRVSDGSSNYLTTCAYRSRNENKVMINLIEH